MTSRYETLRAIDKLDLHISQGKPQPHCTALPRRRTSFPEKAGLKSRPSERRSTAPVPILSRCRGAFGVDTSPVYIGRTVSQGSVPSKHRRHQFRSLAGEGFLIKRTVAASSCNSEGDDACLERRKSARIAALPHQLLRARTCASHCLRPTDGER